MPKKYAEMNPNEVYEFLSAKLPAQAKVYEIGCGTKSATALKDLIGAGKVISHHGYDISKEAVAATKAAGLEASVVISTHDHTTGFKTLAQKGSGATLVMMGLPEVAKDVAENYAKQAKAEGLKVVAYPPL